MDTQSEIRMLRQEVQEMKDMLSVLMPKHERAQEEGMGAYELSRIVSASDPLEAIRERNRRVKARR